ALSPSGETQYVYRVKDGVAERREVTIGERREGKVEILTGVAAGDELVVSGLQRVTDGGPVQIVKNGA
ncbi:efflux transporter periplasmic adaptor subunit, partial [Burkholderia sp. SIMBA_051]